MAEHDPKLLNRGALLECYQHLLNESLTEGYRRALLDEVFDHIDAQGHLLARCGNYINRHQDGEPASFLLAEIHTVMEGSKP